MGLLSLWVEAGRDHSHFWGLTYREIDAILEGNAAKLRNEHNQRAWLAWHTATIPMAKRPPRLSELLIRDKPKPQSIKNMIATARAWTKAFEKRG